MIELKQNKIWSDSLNSFLNFDEPWDYIDKELHKFICFGEGGDSGGDGSGSGDDNVAADFEAAITGAPPGSMSAPTGPGSPAEDLDPGFPPTPPPDDPLEEFDPGELGQYGQDPFGGLDTTIGEVMDPTEILGFEFDQFGFRGFKPGEFIADILDVINPFAGMAGRGLAGITGIADDLGLNTQNPISEIAALAGNIGLTDTATALAPAAQAVDTGISSVTGGLADLGNEALETIGIDIGPVSAPAQSPISTPTSTPVSTPVDDFNFDDDPSPNTRRPRGIASIVQNPLEVRPKEEVQPSSRFGGFIRRPFVFTPGRIFAQTGGGIQNLINEQPSLIDVVNKGMAIPDETMPSQRPEQFIKGQEQPGGLRSTNYYTNAMQPASFYAQPQQVRNYGSIY
jgi:hypothetical protein